LKLHGRDKLLLRKSISIHFSLVKGLSGAIFQQNFALSMTQGDVPNLMKKGEPEVVAALVPKTKLK
jgi:hypothetical protein